MPRLSIMNLLKRMLTHTRPAAPTSHTRLGVEGLEARETPATGALDPSFSGDGLARFGYDEANDAVLQRDGKIVIVGSIKSGNGTDDFAVVRLNPDGSRDHTFSGDGLQTIGFDSYLSSTQPPSHDHANAVALLPDGRIVVVGQSYDVFWKDDDFAVAILRPNGEIDTSFGFSGRLEFQADLGLVSTENQQDFATDVLVQPNGKVVVVGNVKGKDGRGMNIAALRLNPDGSKFGASDLTFGTNGSTVIGFDFGDTKDEYVSAAALQSDGKIVIAGSIDSSSHDFEVAVIRLNPNGSKDNTFDGNGLRQVELDFGGGGHDYAAGVAIQPDGKIVVAASGQTAASGKYNLAVIRLNSNGSSDASFGTGGVRRLDAGLDDDQNHFPVALQPDGKIVVGAVSYPVNRMNGYYIARLNPNGTSDPTFGSGGSVTVTPPGAASDDNYLGAILLQPDGKMVLVGTTDTDSAAGDDMAVARLLGANEPVVVGPATLPGGQVGSGYSATITASGPSGPFTFAVTAGGLPAGLTLNTAGTLSGSPTTAGTLSFTVTATNGAGESGSRAYTLTVTPAAGGGGGGATPTLSRNLVVGGANGSASVFAPNAAGRYGSPAASLVPFPGFAGSVRTATGDVNGDGTADTILVTGPGTPIRVAVVSGKDGSTLVAPFDPFGGDFLGGGFVTAGDFDRDGRAEFVVTPDRGGGPRISIFSLSGASVVMRANFLTIEESFRGGARPGAGDINRDGVPDLVVSAGFLGGPRIVVLDGTKVLSVRDFTADTDKLVGDFFAYSPELRNGAYVAIGDVNGDGFGDLVFGAGPGGGPEIRIASGQTLLTSGSAAALADPIADYFLAGDLNNRGGVRVAVKDADGDNKADVVAGTGGNQASFARVYLGRHFTNVAEPTTFQDLDPFAGAVLADGVYVG